MIVVAFKNEIDDIRVSQDSQVHFKCEFVVKSTMPSASPSWSLKFPRDGKMRKALLEMRIDLPTRSAFGKIYPG